MHRFASHKALRQRVGDFCANYTISYAWDLSLKNLFSPILINQFFLNELTVLFTQVKGYKQKFAVGENFYESNWPMIFWIARDRNT